MTPQATNAPKPAMRAGSKLDKSNKNADLIKWVLIVSVASLLLCMVLPVVLSLAMRLELHADRQVEPQDLAANYPMQGAVKEKLDMITSTDYLSTFVPTRLAERATPFAMIEVLYGPLFLTGMTIDLMPDLNTRSAGFTGYTHLSLASNAPAFVFFILLLGLLFVIGMSHKNMNDVLTFIIGITITWLVWAILVALLSGLLTHPVLDVVNQVLGRSANPLKYAPRFWDALGAPLKVFIVGMVYWVLVYLVRKAKEDSVSRKIDKQTKPV
jgi:hypothetical protein